jgi:hypothetical protein
MCSNSYVDLKGRNNKVLNLYLANAFGFLQFFSHLSPHQENKFCQFSETLAGKQTSKQVEVEKKTPSLILLLFYTAAVVSFV